MGSPPAPDSLHGDPVLDEMAEQEQKAAVKAALMVTKTLRALGFDFVVVRVAKVLSRNGMCAVPGASVFEADDKVVPGLKMEAESLRLLAADIDAEFARRGTFEAEEGYTENASHRMVEFEEPGS